MAGKKQPNPIDIHVGSRVRLKRMMAGMSQEKLGEHLGVTFQQVQKYEKGANRVSASKLQTISSVLNVPVSFFFDEAPGPASAMAGGATGMQEESSGYLVEFLSSSEGLQLNRAFSRIQDPKVRKRIVDLVRSLAEDEEGAE